MFPNDSNPSWVALDQSRTHLYSANETSDYNGTKSGSVSAYSINRADGHLTLMNTVSSEGAGPAHLSLHPGGKHALVANYYGGTIAVIPILANGSVGKAIDVKHDQGTLGPVHAASGCSRQLPRSPDTTTPTLTYDPLRALQASSLCPPTLALDQIFIWKFDAQEREAHREHSPASVAVPPGDGPRHFAFSSRMGSGGTRCRKRRPRW